MAYIVKEKLLEDLCSECKMKSLCDEKTCRVYQLIKKASEVNTLVDWWDRYCDGCTYQKTCRDSGTVCDTVKNLLHKEDYSI